MAVNTLSLKIADITIKVKSDVEFKRFDDLEFYKDFMIKTDECAYCRLDHKIADAPDIKTDGGYFSPLNAWRLSRSGRKNVLCVGPSRKMGRPENLTVFDPDYSKGKMYQESGGELFRGFIDQFLIANLLSRNNGFLLHASGVAWEGKGLCFSGPSGAGKSTLLNMFKDEVERKHLLNDDKLALRKTGNKWRIFGTPWYGESRVSSSSNAPLSELFFIHHSKTNHVRRLSAAEICPQLMTQALLPLWDEEATSRALGIFQDLIESIPVYELGFVPDKSALELIKKTIK
jgi:hypothetical protein